jgi:hypothetical protein
MPVHVIFHCKKLATRWLTFSSFEKTNILSAFFILLRGFLVLPQPPLPTHATLTVDPVRPGCLILADLLLARSVWDIPTNNPPSLAQQPSGQPDLPKQFRSAKLATGRVAVTAP